MLVACAAWTIAGAANGWQNLGTQALTAARAPEELRGRVFAAVNAVTTTSNMLGTVAAAGVVTALGPERTLIGVGGGVLALGAAVVTYRVSKRRVAEQRTTLVD